MIKTILALHAHPDDVEILAGGKLARLSEAGAGARHIGAEYRCAEFRDLAIFNDDRSRRQITEVLRQVRPDVVLTAAPADYMSDHETTSTLVRDACFGASAPNYATHASWPVPALPAIPHLYFMDPIGGVDRENRPVAADFYVDIGTTFETKRAMLAEHSSQREWLRQQHGMDDYLLTLEGWTRELGRRAGG